MRSPLNAARVYLGLGSNLGDRRANLRQALRRLEEQVAVDAVSALYETPPMGPPDQPWYLNAACGGTTGLDPRELLAFIKGLERGLGRVASVRWGPRAIDIDILFYGDLVLRTPELVIPHPGVPNRRFVLAPMTDIAPEFMHPQLEETISALLSKASGDTAQLRRIAGSEEWYPCTK